MPRTSLFNFFDRFRTGLIGDAKKQPRYSDDIQLVSVVQDISGGGGGGSGFAPGWAAPDPILAEYGVQFIEASVAAQRARIELLALATGGGLWVEQGLASGDVNLFAFTIAALTGLGTTLNPTAANSSAFGSGAAATAILEHGTTALGNPANAWRFTIGTTAHTLASIKSSHFPIYVAPGRVFVLHSFNSNFSVNWGLQWREIP